MTGALPETPVVCLVCETPAFHGDRFCEACGALLPESAISQPTRALDLEQLFSHTGRIGRLEYLDSAVILTLFLLLALGLLAAMTLTRLMKSLLFAVVPTDVPTFIVVCVSLGIVALVASYLPARRATKVDPVIALRNK